MTTTNFYRLPKERPAHTLTQRVAGGLGMAILLLTTGFAAAQAAPATNPNAPLPTPPVVNSGFFIHQTVDLGGHMVGISGSGSMYDTLVNIQSGPRVLGQTITLRAVPGIKHPLLDTLTGYTNGFGGDPLNVVKLDFSKGKQYEFGGLWRRDRQYFDYDLLGNPNIPGGQSIPIGPSNAPVGQLPWSQVLQSPFMFNTVRHMLDTNLTLFPLSKLTFRVGYSQNSLQGPSRSPSGYGTVAGSTVVLEEYQRNSTDDFMGAVDWKPLPQTKFTFEEQVDHYKGDSYFVLAPSQYIAQEADGTPVSLGSYDSTTPYGISSCNKTSMGSGYTSATVYTILSPAQTPGALPVVNPACNVAINYLRSQPTRVLFPTEIFRFQSSSIKNIAMNGDFRYTKANSHLPNYYENWNGLDGAIRNATFTGAATASRQEVGFDYGITWEATKKLSFSDQIDFSNVHQPGTTTINEVNYNTPTTVVPGNNGYETVNYTGTLTQVINGSTTEGGSSGTPLPGYFGQKFVTNNASATWDVAPWATFSVTYRYTAHDIVQGAGAGGTVTNPTGTLALSTVSVNTNGGVFNVALRPTEHWNINGTFEAYYANNAFTPVSPRQTKIYRVHTTYKPKTWASIAASYLDTERHNNTSNVTPGAVLEQGPLQHVDHNRAGSISADLAPSEHYSFDFTYGYTDVYASTNICYLNGASPTLPGTASLNSAGGPNICPGVYARGSTTVLSDWGPTKDFMDAPTQYANASLTVTPTRHLQGSLGYIISAVSGNQFFNDARSVNGSLQSAYQSPYVHLAYTVHPGWVFRADYNYYGYGEGGPSGSPLCSTSTTLTSVVVPCNSPTLAPYPTGLNEPSSGLTAPRNFHANLVTLSMHYEF